MTTTTVLLLLTLCLVMTYHSIEAFNQGTAVIPRRPSKTSLLMGIRTQRFRALNRNKLKREERAPLLTLEQKQELFEKMEKWAEAADLKDFWTVKEGHHTHNTKKNSSNSISIAN